MQCELIQIEEQNQEQLDGKAGRVIAGILTFGLSEAVIRKRERAVAAEQGKTAQLQQHLDAQRAIMEQEKSPVPLYAAGGLLALAAVVMLKKKRAKK